MYRFIGKPGQMYKLEGFEQKLNYNCPAEEKNGEGPGSCGGKEPGEGGQTAAPVVEEKKKGGFLSGLFGKKEKPTIKEVSWKGARDFSTEDLGKMLEEHLKIAKEGSDADKKQALKNIKNINEVLSMRIKPEGYRGNYKTTRKY